MCSDLWEITKLTLLVFLVSQDIPKFAVTASFFRTLRYISVVIIFKSYFTRWCVIFQLLLHKVILIDGVFFVLGQKYNMFLHRRRLHRYVEKNVTWLMRNPCSV